MTNDYEIKTSSHCFLIDCIVRYDKENMREIMRFPQFVFNELNKIRPYITRAIIGTKNDFFYDQKIENEKWQSVTELWDKWYE